MTRSCETAQNTPLTHRDNMLLLLLCLLQQAASQRHSSPPFASASRPASIPLCAMIQCRWAAHCCTMLGCHVPADTVQTTNALAASDIIHHARSPMPCSACTSIGEPTQYCDLHMQIADDIPRRRLPEEFNATWGLDLMDQPNLPLDHIYHYNYNGVQWLAASIC